MIDGHSVLAVVPARAGSKGLPGKNTRELCGKPLIAWSIEAGLRSRYIDEVLLSTDGEAIAEIGRRYGAAVPFLRPAELASDTATSYAVVEHALKFYETQLGRRFDYLVLLEPTSPLRERDDIDTMLEKLTSLADRYDAIVSVGEVHDHPAIMKRLAGDAMEPYFPNVDSTGRRQDRAPAYYPYGIAYIVKTATLLQEKTFYPGRTTYKVVQRHQCYEIDDLYDFLAIESIMKWESESQ